MDGNNDLRSVNLHTPTISCLRKNGVWNDDEDGVYPPTSTTFGNDAMNERMHNVAIFVIPNIPKKTQNLLLLGSPAILDAVCGHFDEKFSFRHGEQGSGCVKNNFGCNMLKPSPQYMGLDQGQTNSQ